MNRPARRARLFTLLALVPILVPFLVSPSSLATASTLPYFALPSPLELESLITKEAPSEATLLERADASDFYRIPGKGSIQNPWLLDGKNHALITVAPFPNFSLIPSFLRDSVPKMGGYSATLSPCFSATQTDCIDELVVVENGQTLRAVPVAKVPPVQVFHNIFDVNLPIEATENFSTFEGDRKRGYPSGGDSWLWRFKGDEKLYAASVNFAGYIPQAQEIEKAPWLKYPAVKIQIVPVDVDYPICRDPNYSGCAWTNIEVGKDGAIFSNSEISLKRSLFSKSGTFSISFRTSLPWNSWMVGSVNDLQLEFQQVGDSFHYTVSGEASQIPSARKTIPLTEANNDELRTLSGCRGDQDCFPTVSLGGRNYVFEETFEKLDQVEKLTDRMSTHSVTAWILMSTTGAGYGDPRSLPVVTCIDKAGLNYPAGASVSNATIFEQAPPIWDKSERSFSYRVGAFHLTKDGMLQEGDYSFLISKKIADCLWGSSTSPSSIRVEIVNGNVTSTIINSTSLTNSTWMRFRASGFHFSSPKFVMREAKAESKANAMKTLTCVKGKTTKVVTAPKPKCPKGFKKKF